MPLDLEELKFGGKIVTIAEGELSASITDDEGGEFVAMLYKEYLAQGKPKNTRAWLRTELKKHFVFLTKPPIWIEKLTIPKWPFFGGKPMVFIEQISVPENDVAEAKVFAGAVLYIFGARKPIDVVPGGWTMTYRVIEQVQGL